MKSYHTATSDEGLRLPHSGLLVGLLADAFRLKSVLHDRAALGASYKTAQRYFDGVRVDPATVDAILLALVTALVPREVAVGAPDGSDNSLRSLVGALLRLYARRWDEFAARVNASAYPVSKPGDLPIAPLRFVSLDVGFRIGAWTASREIEDRVRAPFDGSILRDGALGRLIDELRDGHGLTAEGAAFAAGVSTQTMSAWRSGDALPTSDHIVALAAGLANEKAARDAIEYRLRLAVAVQDVRKRLSDISGIERVDDFVAAVELTARHVHDFFMTPLGDAQPPTLDLEEIALWRREKEERRPVILRAAWTVLIWGAACPLGRPLAEYMAGVARYREGVAADFLALPGDWTERACYWTEQLGAAPQRVEFLKRYNEANGTPLARSMDDVGARILSGALRMAEFDWRPGPDAQWIRVSPPPFGKAMNRVAQAQVAESIGDLALAIEHMRHAVRHVPDNASLHFHLASLLWRHGRETQVLSLMEDGLLECRIAVQQDPEFGNARNEIGIILANLRRHEEAERAYAEAEAFFGDQAHHWLARGQNYLALKRYDDARAAFEKAIDFTKDAAHVEAKAHLAATLMALGRTPEGRRLGKKVAHVLGRDPSKRWEDVLDVWCDRYRGGVPPRSRF